MAMITANSPTWFPTGNSLSATFHALSERLRLYASYRATLAELEALPDEILEDIALYRGGIRAAARDAVYGARGA